MANSDKSNSSINTDERMRDTDLWISFIVPRFVRATNMEEAEATLKCANEYTRDNMITRSIF